MADVDDRNKRCTPLTSEMILEGFGSGDGCSAVMLLILCIISVLIGAAIGYMVCKRHMGST